MQSLETAKYAQPGDPGIVADALKYLTLGLHAYKAGPELPPSIGNGVADEGAERRHAHVLQLRHRPSLLPPIYVHSHVD